MGTATFFELFSIFFFFLPKTEEDSVDPDDGSSSARVFHSTTSLSGAAAEGQEVRFGKAFAASRS